MNEFGSYDPITGRYSGPINDLQNGIYDVLFTPVFYPIYDHTDIVGYTRPVVEDRMEIFSMYNMTKDDPNNVTDILFMFSTIPILLWVFLAISFVLFMFVLDLGFYFLRKSENGKMLFIRRSRLKRNRTEISRSVFGVRRSSDSLWISICAFLHQKDFPSNGTYVVVLSLFTIIGLFCAVAFLTNSVSTDLVVVSEPVTIQCYDDILSILLIGVLTNNFFSFSFNYETLRIRDRKRNLF